MVHLWVVNDLADDKEPAIFKYFARGIGEIDRAFDTVAKTKLFRQPHGGVADRNHSARATYLIDDVAAVMRFDLFLHRGHNVRGAQINFLARRRAAGNKIRAHRISGDLPRTVYSSKGPLGF